MSYFHLFVVKLDPRVNVRQQMLRKQLDLSMAIDKALGEVVTARRAASALLDTLRKKGMKDAIVDSLSTLTKRVK